MDLGILGKKLLKEIFHDKRILLFTPDQCPHAHRKGVYYIEDGYCKECTMQCDIKTVSVQRFQQWLMDRDGENKQVSKAHAWYDVNNNRLNLFASATKEYEARGVKVVRILVLCHGHAHRDWKKSLVFSLKSSRQIHYAGLLVDRNAKAQPDIVLDVIQDSDKLANACKALDLRFDAVVFLGVTSIVMAHPTLWQALAPCLVDTLVVAGCGRDSVKGISLCRESIRTAISPKKVEFTNRI